ncbi:unnamed protein product [Schistocephalus solidus]|uniref:Endo/exonuclease/phosphatase domain-containing protein n=1 Tax=Schistocephalus solidus TaxID=70667 RepID=A0A183SXJ9_SCHSO|nr:unnamed protein product [Schistocephalus solidus]
MGVDVHAADADGRQRLISAATPRATVTTGGLSQVRVPGAVCASTPKIPTTSPISKVQRRPRLTARKIRGLTTVTNHNTPYRHPTHHTLRAARVCTLPLAAWNLNFLLDNPRSNRPERRMALVARELARYEVDIADLSETLVSEQGQLEELGAGNTFFWSGWPKAERRDASVAFVLWNDIVG